MNMFFSKSKKPKEVKKKPKEFWISTNTMKADLEAPNYVQDYYSMYKVIHVREVMPIDWKQIWIDYTIERERVGYKPPYDYIEFLVEKQLKEGS